MISTIGAGQKMSGAMSAESVMQRRNDVFNTVDSNGDGGIDTVELSELALEISQKSGTTINAEETFSTYDADGNGSMSVEELGTFMQDNAPPSPEGMSGKPPGPPPGGEDMFGKLDTTGDGGIDTDEFAVLAAEIAEKSGTSVDTSSVFSQYDTNGDGVLSSEEMQAYLQDNAPQKGPRGSGDEGAGNVSSSSGGANVNIS